MTDAPAAGDEPKPQPEGLGALLREGVLKLARTPRLGRRGVRLLVAVVVIGWAATSIYRVQPDEQGVVLRFGRWIDTTQPGLHVHLPFPVDTVLFPKVTQINQVQLGNPGAPGDPASGRERQMLTGDENIVEADCAVFWKIRDAGEFLFRVNAPEAAVKIAAEGALRDVISRTPIQAAMSDKRQQIADQTKAVLQSLLDSEHAGIEITQVQLLRVEPPLAVIDAFNDVQRARADQERARNEAEAYANDILPRARGDAERIRQDAEAYKTQVVNLAQGDANAFLAVYDSYQRRQGRHRLAPLSRQRRRDAAQGDQGHPRHFGQGRLERRALHAGDRDARSAVCAARLRPARCPAERRAARRCGPQPTPTQGVAR